MFRKIIILVTGVCVAFASCVKEEAGESEAPQEISYQTVIALPTTTRADMTNKTSYPTTVPFGTYAYFLPAGSTWDLNKASAALYVPNSEIKYSAGTWRAATTYYWPKLGSLTFFAYSPRTIASFSGFSWGKTGVSLTGWNAASNPGIDLMVADITKDKKANTSNYEYNGVPTLFRHKLACISFKAKLDANYANRTVTLQSLELTNINTTGDYVADQWINQGTLKSFSQCSNTSLALTTTAQDVGTIQKRKVIPQALDANAYFNVTYKVTTTVSGIVTTESFTKKIQIKTITPAWYMNKDITFTLLVSLGSGYIEFSPVVGDWTEAGNSGDLTVH